jgi:protein gp37
MTTVFAADAWWDASWSSQIGGCKANAPGCRNCFAPFLLHAYSHAEGWHGNVHHGVIDVTKKGKPYFNGRIWTAAPGRRGWSWPLRWAGAKHPKLGPGQPSLIFIADVADLFLEGRPEADITRVCATVAASKHIGLVVTRRPRRMLQYFSTPDPRTVKRWQPKLLLGFSAERQDYDKHWASVSLLAEAGWFVFVSLSPVIGPITLPPDLLALGQRTWVIFSGEQGKHENCRPLDLNWARAVRDQCRAAGISFFFKQLPKQQKRIPPDLQLREFPKIEAVRSAKSSGGEDSPPMDESTRRWLFRALTTPVGSKHKDLGRHRKNRKVYAELPERSAGSKRCWRCGEYPTAKGHDPCLANLPSVIDACCGHGVERAYLVLANGFCLTGRWLKNYLEKIGRYEAARYERYCACEFTPPDDVVW